MQRERIQQVPAPELASPLPVSGLLVAVVANVAVVGVEVILPLG